MFSIVSRNAESNRIHKTYEYNNVVSSVAWGERLGARALPPNRHFFFFHYYSLPLL